MNKLLIVFAVFFSFQLNAQTNLTKDDLTELKNRLDGNFDSQEQSQTNKGFQNISLHMKEIALNPKAKPNLKSKTKTVKQPEGVYIYAEQSLMSSPEQPTSQHIYFITRKGDSVLVCQVYEMKAPFRFVGAWNDASLLKKISVDSLIESPGCTMYFYKSPDGNYYGGTRGNGCVNSLKDASYSTYEMTIYPNMLVNWERGFDAADKQVWGPDKAGYRFRKFIPLRRKD